MNKNESVNKALEWITLIKVNCRYRQTIKTILEIVFNEGRLHQMHNDIERIKIK